MVARCWILKVEKDVMTRDEAEHHGVRVRWYPATIPRSRRTST